MEANKHEPVESTPIPYSEIRAVIHQLLRVCTVRNTTGCLYEYDLQVEFTPAERVLLEFTFDTRDSNLSRPPYVFPFIGAGGDISRGAEEKLRFLPK